MHVSEPHAVIETILESFREDLPVHDGAPAAVHCATAYIHDRLFDADLTVARMREELALTDATFSARFRRYHGRTPSAYIRHLRVAAAKELLRHEALRIADIAFYVGYEHYRTFARVFKRITGCSPQAFRDRLLAS